MASVPLARLRVLAGVGDPVLAKLMIFAASGDNDAVRDRARNRGVLVLLPNLVVQGIVDGRVTHVYRRWDVPRARPGGRQLTKLGLIAIDAVEEVPSLDSISEADAVACGEKSVATLTKWLMKRPEDRIYKISLHYAGPDPRWELREQRPDEAGLLAIDAALDRLDKAKTAGSNGPWTRHILRWIRDNPAVVSKVLATLLDRELQPMKTDIRKMKALGLTISLDVGYELSPRGAAYLAWYDARR